MIIPGTQDWAPGIGDPTPMGWFTVAAYVATALLCARNVPRARAWPVEHRVWIALTALLVLLALNKQLDLQTWFTAAGRDLARADGWYEQRQVVQRAFIAALLVLSVLVVLVLQRLLGDAWKRYAAVSCGLALLLVFIVIRAATMHHVDRLLGTQVGLLRVNHLLELGAIAIVAIGAWNWRPPGTPTVEAAATT